jgi:hypothetical protein
VKGDKGSQRLPCQAGGMADDYLIDMLMSLRPFKPSPERQRVLVWCKACYHRAPDSGRGDEPLKDLKFRCTKCGSKLTDHVTMARHALRIQPWRGDDADSTSGSTAHLRGQRPWSG